MFVDLHLTPQSAPPTTVAQAARNAGLHGAVVTETNRVDQLPAYLDALRAAGLAAYGGVELALDRGLLVFIPKVVDAAFLSAMWSNGSGRWTPKDAVAACRRFPGAVIAGHPYCRDLPSVLFDAVLTLEGLTGVETRVGRGRPLWDAMADEVAGRRGLAHIGSCGGDLEMLGRALTYVHGERLSQAALVESITDKMVWPIEMEARGQSRPREEEFVEAPRRRDDEDAPEGGEGEDRPRRFSRGDDDRPRRGGDRGDRGSRGPRRESGGRGERGGRDRRDRR